MIDSASSEISKVDSSIRDSVRDEARAYAEAVYDGKGHARIPDILPDSIADAILEKYESVKDDPVRAGVDSRGIAFTDERAAQVQQELRDIFSQEDIDNLISSKDAVIDFVLDYNLRTGLVTREEYDRMKSMYEHYVPLRGWNDEEIAANRERMEGNIFGRSSSLGSELDIERRAKGRITEAADPLASLMSMAQNAIVNGQRNRTLNALVNMYRNNAERMELKLSSLIFRARLISMWSSFYIRVHWNLPSRASPKHIWYLHNIRMCLFSSGILRLH